MLVLGIDPGFTGAIALYDPSTTHVTIGDMPLGKTPTGKSIIDYISLFEMLKPDQPVRAVLEFVAARPGQGAPATFRFGQGYGALEMALAAHRIPTQKVTPAKWKKHFGLSKDKGISRSYATERFPQYAESFKRVKDDGRAEAVLIALYGAEAL